MFDGKDLRGWWEDCIVSHSSRDRVNGGIWFADSNQGILYSKQNENGAGSMLATNRTFGNYELVFDFWPTFGNDAGLFNRTTPEGKSWQTSLDYIEGSGIGGGYSENGWSPININDDPFLFVDTYENPAITTWTAFTSAQDPAAFGCSAEGCTSPDFTRVWNTQGWNQLRVKFYGGLAAGTQVTMETWMRKVQSPPAAWVPIYRNSRPVVTPAGFIAFQIHGGPEKWKPGAINLYRDIKVRELQDDGTPSLPIGVRRTGSANPPAPKGIALAGDRLYGQVWADTEIIIRNASGTELDRFRVDAGRFERSLRRNAFGLLLIELRRRDGFDLLRFCRIR